MSATSTFDEIGDEPETDQVRRFGTGRAEQLLIFVQGFAAQPQEYDGLLQVMQSETQADLYAPPYPSDLLSAADPRQVAADLANRFNAVAASYGRVQFVGHSMGVPFLRAAFLEAISPASPPTRLRTLLDQNAVRMTFLAGTSRGFTPNGLSQTLRIELLLRRWYWLTLLVIALAWSLRPILPQGGVGAAFQVNWSIVEGGIAVGAFAAILSSALASASLSTGAGYLATAAAAWLFWAISGRFPAIGFALAFQLVGTSEVVRALARRAVDGIVMAAVLAVVGAAAPWIAAHPPYVWPATLLLLLPLVLYPMRSRLLLEHIFYGASWITGVRLRWIKSFAPGSGLKPPPIVHLFGEEDRLVGDNDHVEFHHDPEALEVAIRGVAHNDFQLSPALIERPPSDVEKSAPTSRREAFAPPMLEAIRRAVGENPQARLRELGDRSHPVAQAFTVGQAEAPAFRIVEPLQVQKRAGAAALSAPCEAREPEQAVFLVHGIRDFAGWEDSLAARCREVAADHGQRLIEPIEVRYGYFNAFQFLLAAERERATQSFLDLYAQSKARYPNAVCHAAAHSNGTYVVANALRNNEYVELQRVYLAGSVLTRDFDWADVGPNRNPSGDAQCGVIRDRVRSDRAAQDWPVGVLCWLLAGLGRLPFLRTFYGMLGTGGLHGFLKRSDAAGTEFIVENAYLPGPHGEALNSKYHGEIARFLLTGEPIQTTHLLAKSLDRRMLRGVMVLTVLGVLVIGAAVALPALFGPQCAAWGVAVGALTLLVVVRALMAA